MNEKMRRLRKGTPDDWPSLALLEFVVALARAMNAKDMKQKDLAQVLDVSPPYISSVMSGNENLTVEQMSRLAEAAGGSLHITVAKKGLRIRWVEDVLEVESGRSPATVAPTVRDFSVILEPESYPPAQSVQRIPFVKSELGTSAGIMHPAASIEASYGENSAAT